jgi:hypothetical protein
MTYLAFIPLLTAIVMIAILKVKHMKDNRPETFETLDEE